VIVDAYAQVCPQRPLDLSSERHPGAEVAALRKNHGTDFLAGLSNGEDWPAGMLDMIRPPGLSAAGQELVPGANLHRIRRV
jgi:hypothetical protein